MDYHNTSGPCERRGDTSLDQFVLLSCTAVVSFGTKIEPWRLVKIADGTSFAKVAKLHTAEPTP